MTRGKRRYRPDLVTRDAPQKIRVLFFESGRQGGSVLRLCSIMKRMDCSRFDRGVVSYYRDQAATAIFAVPGLFCRYSLKVPWYPQPDVFKPVFGLPIPMPFGVYLFLTSLVLLRRYRPHVAYMNSGIREFAPVILAARLVGTRVVCALRMSRALDAYELRLARYVHRFVASSQWGAAFYQNQVRGRAQATCVYEGIDLAEFDARASEQPKSALPAGPVYVCQVGSLIDRKRPRLAVEAFEIARRLAPNLKLVLAGAGPLQPELEAMVRERDLQTDVLLLGHRYDIPAILRQCHIGLVLSEDEGLPNAILEYMASGLPVVVTRLPFIDELIRHQNNGLVLDEATPQAIGKAIAALARSVESRDRLGKAGREAVETGRFNADREARDVEALLSGLTEATMQTGDDRSICRGVVS